MIFNFSQISFFLEALIFASVIFMHLSRKNSSMVLLYFIQSLSVIFLMLGASLKEMSALSLLAIMAVFAVKIIIAPKFFYALIQKHYLKFTASTYLGTPLTLIVLAMITAFAYSSLFHPLTVLAGQNGVLLIQALAAIFISLFLIINRRSALSQIMGVLSMENVIVSFAINAGLEQAPGLELGIIFDIFVWIIIATVFISMIYKQFGTLDVAAMKHLQEE